MNYQDKSYILLKQSDFPEVDFLKPGRAEVTMVIDHSYINGDYLNSMVLEVKSINHLDIITDPDEIAALEQELQEGDPDESSGGSTEAPELDPIIPDEEEESNG